MVFGGVAVIARLFDLWADACLWASRKLGRPVFGYDAQLFELIDGYLGAVTGLAAIAIMVRHAEQVGGMLEEIAKPLRFMLDDVKDPE